MLLSQSANPDEIDDDGRTPLIHASIDNKLDVAKLLLESRANVNAQDALRNAALHYAAQNYFPEMATLLVLHGATVDVQDVHGNTPLWRAVFNSQGRGDVIKILLEAGAARDHRNKHGKTPMDLARDIANYDVAQFFA